MTYDKSIHTNPDAQAWAKLFMKTRKEKPDAALDEALMICWFANAMMAMHDYLQDVGPINGDHAQHLLDLEADTSIKDSIEQKVIELPVNQSVIQFDTELHELVNSYAKRLTVAEVVGTLEIVKLVIFKEQS